jgi:hypothetical protein
MINRLLHQSFRVGMPLSQNRHIMQTLRGIRPRYFAQTSFSGFGMLPVASIIAKFLFLLLIIKHSLR